MEPQDCMKGSDRYVSCSLTLLNVLLVVGLLARVALAIHGELRMPGGADAAEYGSYAWNLAQGHGYCGISPNIRGLDGQPLDHPTAYCVPGTSTFWVFFIGYLVTATLSFG
jgi:hypothetical protein